LTPNSPKALAHWLSHSLNVEAAALKDLGLRDEDDSKIFFAARTAGAIVLTKDRDFVDLVRMHGAPPQVVWVTCGNTSNAYLQTVLSEAWPAAHELLVANERLVEIGGRTS
jgi:predicted nuclease of predicted toxin-antitoxin system